MRKSWTGIGYVIAFCLSLTLTVFSLQVSAAPYYSYTYNYWGEPVPAPQAYLPSLVLDGVMLGTGELNEPRDLFIDSRGWIYIVDSGNNRVIVLNETWEVASIYNEFTKEGQIHTFNNPRGVFVTDDGEMFIADRDNARIVVLNPNGDFVREIGPPEADVEGIVPAGFRFRPTKVGVDRAGRTYVVSADVYDGLMEYDVDGNFRGFFGAPRVTPNPIDYLWRQIATTEQRKRMALFIPTEFINIDIDDRGFVFAIAYQREGRGESVRRLNPAGVDVLRRMGFSPPQGDVDYPPVDLRFSGRQYITSDIGREALIQGPSTFVDVASRQVDGVEFYSVLDRRRGRIFTYDMNGNLLYLFGGLGASRGVFRDPIALDAAGDTLVVADARKNNITVFEPTEYALLIHNAMKYYHTGDYDRSAKEWSKVLDRNVNYDLAYSGIGRALLRQDQYREAMINFRMGFDRRGYSQAFGLYRRKILSDNFSLIIGSLVFIVILINLFRRLMRSRLQVNSLSPAQAEEHAIEAAGVAVDAGISPWKKLFMSMLYSLHVILHPFSGFWDLKHEKRGNGQSASCLLCLVIFTYIFMRQFTGFLFNPYDVRELNLIVEIASVLIPFALWCVANWSITTLLEGQGTLKDIYIASSYALVPIIVINLPVTVISNFLILEEGSFYYLMVFLAALWSGTLLFTGHMVTHDYNGPKSILTIIYTIIFIGFGIFLIMLFINLMFLILDFVTDIYRELYFRI